MNLFHRKIVFNDSPWKPFYFADLYRFGDIGAVNRPLLYYIGGAGDANRYKELLRKEPDDLLGAIKKAMTDCNVRDLDFMVSPAPITTPEQRDSRAQDFLDYFLACIISQSLGQIPSKIALQGNAYGSFFAMFTGFSLRQCVAVNVTAGMGLIEAAERSGDIRRRDLSITCYSNEDDVIRSWSDEFAAHMKQYGVEVEINRRPGEKRFEDYLENGAIHDSFRRALVTLGRAKGA